MTIYCTLLNDMATIYKVFHVESSSADNKNIKYKLTDKNDPTRIMWVRLVQGELATVEFYDPTGILIFYPFHICATIKIFHQSGLTALVLI